MRLAEEDTLLSGVLFGMFGMVPEVPQTEDPFYPRSPYGCAESCLLADSKLPRVLQHARDQRHPL